MDPRVALRELRETAELQGKDVAAECGLYPSELSRIESGDRPLSVDVYVRILNAILVLRDRREKAFYETLSRHGLSNGNGKVVVPPQTAEIEGAVV